MKASIASDLTLSFSHVLHCFTITIDLISFLFLLSFILWLCRGLFSTKVETSYAITSRQELWIDRVNLKGEKCLSFQSICFDLGFSPQSTSVPRFIAQTRLVGLIWAQEEDRKPRIYCIILLCRFMWWILKCWLLKNVFFSVTYRCSFALSACMVEHQIGL